MRDLGAVAETGQKLQRLLAFDREASELADHEVDDVVGVTLGADALEIPGPAGGAMVECEQVLLGKRVEKLNDEERVAARLLAHKLRQRRAAPRLAAKRIGNQLFEVLRGKRREGDLLHLSAFVLDRCELARQRMCGIDLVVAVGADQQQMVYVLLAEQIHEQIERGRVEPLQIVEEERQRMFGPRENADEPPEHQLETPLCVLWREFGDRRLLADDEVQFGDEVDHEPSVRPQRLAQRVAPARQLDLALTEKRPYQALKRLDQRRIRYVALVLIELAGGEKAARRYQRLMQLVDDGGLADAGIAGDQHQLRPAGGDDAVEGGEQGIDLALSPVELLGDQRPVRCVPLAQREGVDPAVSLPFSKAASEVVLQAGCGLVALLGGLGEQLQDDGGDRGGDRLPPLAGRHRFSRDMAVDPFHGIGRDERQ